MTSILVVDDSRSVRTALRRLVEWTGRDLEIAATCATGAEAITATRAGAAFDVALVDLGLPDMPGTEVIRALAEIRPDACLIAFTVRDDTETILGAIAAGARGYLLKGTPPDRVLSGIREAAVGGAPLTPRVARLVLETLGEQHRPKAVPPGLTPREGDVLSLLARGVTYAEAARSLGIGLGTIQSHVKSIYRKLDVGSKTEAAAVALAQGMV